MGQYTVSLTENEVMVVEEYSEANGRTVEESLRKIVTEKLEILRNGPYYMGEDQIRAKGYRMRERLKRATSKNLLG